MTYNFPTPAKWDNERCHRSGNAAPQLAATHLSRELPDVNVVFENFACSGARIEAQNAQKTDGGILDPYVGQVDKTSHPLIPPQIDQVADMARAANRPLDALVINAGADDINWTDLLTYCYLPFTNCGSDAGGAVFRREVSDLLRLLPARYDNLARRIEQLTLPDGRPIVAPGRVFVTEYYDLAHDQNDRISSCESGLLSRSELQYGYHSVEVPLNDVIHHVGDHSTYGWHLIGGIASDFARHGCGSNRRWVNALSDSFALQGDDLGILHPNSQGQADIASHIEATLRPILSGGPPSPSICYQAHVQNIGWQSTWNCDGQMSGTTGRSLRLEALRIRPKGVGTLCVQASVVGIGDQSEQCGTDGSTLTVGTTGQARAIEMLRASITNGELVGNSHLADIGWQGARTGSSIQLGTTGQSRRMEAIELAPR